MTRESKKCPYKYPKWHECQWRREACNKVDCPLCGKILKHNEKMKLKVEDPDSMNSAIEAVKASFSEVGMMLEQWAEEEGIDIEELSQESEWWDERNSTDEHPLYKRMRAWTGELHNFIKEADQGAALWRHTEAGKDLCWYHTMISAKVYRQLCFRWDMDHFDDWEDCDYIYTKGVIKEILGILYDAFDYLKTFRLHEDELDKLNKFSEVLHSLEHDILSI